MNIKNIWNHHPASNFEWVVGCLLLRTSQGMTGARGNEWIWAIQKKIRGNPSKLATDLQHQHWSNFPKKMGSFLKLTSFFGAFPLSPQQMAGYTPQLRTHMIRTHHPIRKGSPTSPLFKVTYNSGFLTKKGSQAEELGDLLIGVLDFRLFLWLLNCWDRIDPHFFRFFCPVQGGHLLL